MSLENNLYAEIKKQWELFVEHQKAPDPSIIRPEIQKAWERCRNHNVNPYADIHQDLLSPAQLAARKWENADLLAVAEPVMEELFHFVERSNFVVWLADCRGICLSGGASQLPHWFT